MPSEQELAEREQWPTISGRELHKDLGIETPYHKWFLRMCQYGFVKNQDYFEITDKIVQNPKDGRPATDHRLTLDMAKEICMLQRNEHGKAMRRHLLEVERQWNTPKVVYERGPVPEWMWAITYGIVGAIASLVLVQLVLILWR